MFHILFKRQIRIISHWWRHFWSKTLLFFDAFSVSVSVIILRKDYFCTQKEKLTPHYFCNIDCSHERTSSIKFKIYYYVRHFIQTRELYFATKDTHFAKQNEKCLQCFLHFKQESESNLENNKKRVYTFTS